MSFSQNGIISSKICERCGQSFSCGPSYTCWCHEIFLTQKQREFIARNFSDCLCCVCLDQIGELL